MSASLDGKPLVLTGYEFALLRALTENAGQVMSREQLMLLVRGLATGYEIQIDLVRAMQAGAQGIKIIVKGRIGGAEIARQEKSGMGSVPLTTLQANVNYGYAIAYTTFGTIGVKVWIYLGMYGEEVADTDVRPGGAGPRRSHRRRSPLAPSLAADSARGRRRAGCLDWFRQCIR